MDKVEKENSNLNRVLYGPPGTGKTYNTINEALKILDRGFYEENILDKNREALKDKFEEYKENGQIEMITFHQNYGYEDFIEGIKAGTNENNDIVYSVEDGILKKMVKRSKPKEANVSSINFDWEKDNIFKMSLGGKNDESILEWCLENDYISMGWGESVDFSEIKGEKFEFFREKSKKKIEGKINEVDKKFTIQAMYAFRQWMKKDDLVFVSVGNLKIVAIAQVIGEYEFKEGTKEIEYSHYRKVKWLFVNREGILREDLLSKKISQQTIYNLKKDYVKKEYFDSLFEREKIIKPYVLIIDEINRGNISKIFGELITLIEDNKRLGNEEALEVTLPYSKEKFGIPNNLHILGTMNTADKSIALMDTALRRRFEFIEMMPDIEKLRDIKVGDTNIDLAKFLETINKRIEFLYDREHTIGHAYFMEIKTKEDLDNVMRNKIIPLLQEYFYEDWEKVQIVLGDYKKQNKAFKFVEAIDLKELDVLGFDYEETEDNVVSYKVNDKFDEIAYKIYED